MTTPLDNAQLRVVIFLKASRARSDLTTRVGHTILLSYWKRTRHFASKLAAYCSQKYRAGKTAVNQRFLKNLNDYR